MDKGHHTQSQPCPLCGGLATTHATLPEQGDNQFSDMLTRDVEYECAGCGLVFSQQGSPQAMTPSRLPWLNLLAGAA